MAFTPISRVYLLDTPLDNTYANQIYFSSTTQQRTYFQGSSVVKHYFDEFSYIRKDNVVGVDEYIDNLLDSNYVAYQNPNFGNKWFYAFITKFEYVNPRKTNIYIETDVYQTWLTECTLKDSFVVREHVMDDTIGKHILDERLEYGEHKMRTREFHDNLSDISFVIAVSDLEPVGITASIGGILSGIYSGLAYFAFDKTDVSGMNDFLGEYITAGKSDAIAFIFAIPSIFIPSSVDSGERIPNGSNASGFNWSIDGNFTDLDGYVPKNKKLFTYPYNFLYASNNQGGATVYKYEDFNIYNVLGFAIIGNIGPNPVIMLCPNNYRGQAGYNQEYGLSMGGYPLCSWNNDTFAAYLAQNYPNIAMGFMNSATSILGGAMPLSSNTLNIGGIAGGIQGTINQMAQIKVASIQPDQARGNTSGGSLNIASDAQYFFVSEMTIKRQYAEIIDDFLTMYGYKVNTVKVPNTNGRPRWNYVQTIDVNIDGHIPTEDMIRLKKMYNDGVTFWRSASYFGNYSANNQIGG